MSHHHDRSLLSNIISASAAISHLLKSIRFCQFLSLPGNMVVERKFELLKVEMRNYRKTPELLFSGLLLIEDNC